ncbi:protein lin-37 homolog isoform X1 [Callorhinus ursinus]|uniref:Protein lin-37 homolog n=1 Tax=Callorhinus ursinus TaxID=34884 RepID=A0A3Q7MTS8_CALUR|nr:protein lin-37 homolog [Callorhinus ursinus]
MLLVCFRKRGLRKVGLRPGSRWRQLSIGQGRDRRSHRQMEIRNCQRGPPTEGKLVEVAAAVAVAAGHFLSAEDWAHTKLTLTSSRLPSALICDPGLFWAPLTQLATLQTQTMFPVKVKVEKSELEMAKARNQLDAVLQCLLEKSHMDRERLEEEAGKTPSDTHNKDCSIAATGKRPSARFPHQRRKKRREMDDGLAEGGPQRSNTYVIKLFDRSVDLAQFSENTPLYPICRAWMRNSPSVRERERSPSSPLPPLPEDEETSEVTNSKSRDVYKLPPPTAPGPPGDACRSRIPSPLQPEIQGTPDDEPSEPEPSPSTLIYRNMQRWKRIRQRWKEASHRNQLRYSESMKILREMYERQ